MRFGDASKRARLKKGEVFREPRVLIMTLYIKQSEGKLESFNCVLV